MSVKKQKVNRLRNVVFTWNNYTNDDILYLENLFEKHFDYIVYGREVAPTTLTPHLQGYAELKKQTSFKKIAKLFKNNHIEARKGSQLQAITYCKKDGDYDEHGVYKEQGKRNDLNELKDDIINGKVTVDDIVLENPEKFHQYGRTLNKIEDLAMRKKYRTEMTKGIWLYGGTGTGKSLGALDGYTPETHYIVPKDNGWWDGYTQQETVVLNDFRGEMPYNDMLQLVDRWPYHVRRRGREPLPFISKTVYVTSSLHPEKIYKNRDKEDKIEQLLRRFIVINLDETDKSTQKCSGNTRPSTSYMDLDDEICCECKHETDHCICIKTHMNDD